MPKLLGILGRRQGVSGPERDRMVGEALRLQREMTPDSTVVATLQARGAPNEVATQINAEARARVDREVAASVRLPASVKRDINFYFLLGVTPVAAPDQIHRAYRRKAKEVHPDRHAAEFVVDQWQDLMTVVADASDVLTDPRKRRAYDVYWRQRSQTVAMKYRKKGEQRGDHETRFLWEIAEMAELEEAMSTLLEELRRTVEEGSDGAPVAGAICKALEGYEGRMIELRTQARALPDPLAYFAERVRAEMQRKERLVTSLRHLLPRNPEHMTHEERQKMSARVEPARDVLAEIRHAQNLFELGTARPFL